MVGMDGWSGRGRGGRRWRLGALVLHCAPVVASVGACVGAESADALPGSSSGGAEASSSGGGVADDASGISAGDTAGAADDGVPPGCDDGSNGYSMTSDTGGGAEDSGGGLGDDIPIGATVFAVRGGEFGPGTLIEITDVVVIAPVVAVGTGSLLFVQAVDGGEYSGISVHVPASVPAVDPGMRVRVVGRVAIDLSSTQIVVDEVLGEVVDDGDAPIPDATTLAADELAAPSSGPAPWESTLVRIATPTVRDDGVCPGEFALTGALRVDDLFLGAQAPSPAAGATYAAITGVLRFTDDDFELAPRSLADLEM